MADIVAGKASPATPGGTEATASETQLEPVRHPLVALREEMDRLFEDFFAGSLLAPFGGRRRFEADPWPRLGPLGMRSPAIDLAETDKEYRIAAELPGMAENDIELTLANGPLTLKGEKQERKEEHDKDSHVSERRYGAVKRSFRLPDDVDAERIEAGCKDGMLTIILPKTEQAQATRRMIEVKAGG